MYFCGLEAGNEMLELAFDTVRLTDLPWACRQKMRLAWIQTDRWTLGGVASS
jgi:hypothetical protein